MPCQRTPAAALPPRSQGHMDEQQSSSGSLEWLVRLRNESTFLAVRSKCTRFIFGFFRFSVGAAVSLRRTAYTYIGARTASAKPPHGTHVSARRAHAKRNIDKIRPATNSTGFAVVNERVSECARAPSIGATETSSALKKTVQCFFPFFQYHIAAAVKGERV